MPCIPRTEYPPKRYGGVHMDNGLPLGVEVQEVIRETPSVSTIRFDHRFSFKPGQFVMVWVPGVDEVPMALSSSNSITVQNVGTATSALTAMHPGDMIGIRGPFGNGFETREGTLAIAGGVGAAPLFPLAMTGVVRDFIIGAKTGSELLFVKPLGVITRLHVLTDDGSAGKQGFAVRGMDDIELGAYSQVCVCGPEKMMAAVLRRLDEAGLAGRGRFSLHRYMKCGSGVCGSCCIDPGGLRVCRDGPVFPGDVLLESEFGRYARDGSGVRKSM